MPTGADGSGSPDRDAPLPVRCRTRWVTVALRYGPPDAG